MKGNIELNLLIITKHFFIFCLSAVEAVQQGKLTEDKVREMVSPLFYTRMRLGEFDPPEMNPYNNLTSAEVETEEHRALAEEAALKSFVLLKNNGVLPFFSLSFFTVAVSLLARTSSFYHELV